MLRAAFLGLILAAAAAGGPALPAHLVDIDGVALDLGALTGEGQVVVVTMKTAACPVCARQLTRLERQRRALELCGARFVVLAPGPVERIRAAREATGFSARWIEDTDLAIARALGLVLGPGQIVPSILEVDARGQIVWQQRGRSDEIFGDRALRAHLRCEPGDA